MKTYLCALSVILLSSVMSEGRAEPITVTATPIPLDESAPETVRVGPLEYLGGLHLSSTDGRFGGFSGLGVSADGRRIVSVSDQGASLDMYLTYDADGRLNGVDKPDLSALADLDGTMIRGKRWSDAESMSPGVNGEIIVAFERDHRLWRYDPGATAPKVLRPPAEISTLPGNAGIEALTLLNDGRLLAIAEGDPDEDVAIAWVSRADGWDVMTYRTGDGFRATGAATLPNGDVLVLERYFTPRNGVRIRIKRLSADDIEAGAELNAPVLVDLRPPLSVDNFEGIDVRPEADGKAIVYLISDDNFSGRQRTLLLMFGYTP